MSHEALTHEALERAIKKGTLSYVFLKGPGGPLLFLWVLAAGLLGVVLDQPLWALIVTGICAVSGGLIVREHLCNPQVQRQLIHTILTERARVGEITQDALRDKVARGVTYVTEVVAKIRAITTMHGPDTYLLRLLGEADDMVALQVALAKQSEEFQRILALVQQRRGATRTTQGEKREDHTTRLQQENVTALKDAYTKALASVDEINQQLETMMLQVVQMEKQAIDLVRTEEVAEQATETLRRLQADLDARRATAEELIRWFR